MQQAIRSFPRRSLIQAVAVVALASVTRPAGLAGRGKSPHGLRGTEQGGHRDTEPQRFFLFLCLSVTLWLISPCLAARVGLHHGLLAQAKRPMTLVDIVQYSRLLDPQLSADGAHLLYQLHQ